MGDNQGAVLVEEAVIEEEMGAVGKRMALVSLPARVGLVYLAQDLVNPLPEVLETQPRKKVYFDFVYQ